VHYHGATEMNRLLVLPVLLLTLLIAGHVFAADFQKGLEAYEKGDYLTARQEWQPLAEQGHADAQFNLGIEYERMDSHKDSIKLFRLAEEQGHPAATHWVGLAYSLGHGVPQNLKTAIKWFELASKRGNVGSHYVLGKIYEFGEGVPQDDKTAMKWYRLAAENGYLVAQFVLGLKYRYGTMILQDFTLAHMWFNIAASRGHGAASGSRDQVAKEMTRTQIETAQRLAGECVAKKYKGC